MFASTALGVAGSLIFSVWFLLTIAFQANSPLTTVIRRFDRFNLVPRWSFFAPDPGASNYHFLYRSQTETTSVGPWREVNLSPRGAFFVVWNPHKRYREGMIELFQLLALSRVNHSVESLQFTSPYLILLGVARTQLGAAPPRRSFYQFALVETRGPSGGAVPVVRFYSLSHPVS